MNKQLISNSFIRVCLENTVGTYQLRVNYIIFNRTKLYLNSSSLKSWSSCNFTILLSIRVLFQVFILIIGRHLIAALGKYFRVPMDFRYNQVDLINNQTSLSLLSEFFNSSCIPSFAAVFTSLISLNPWFSSQYLNLNISSFEDSLWRFPFEFTMWITNIFVVQELIY